MNATQWANGTGTPNAARTHKVVTDDAKLNTAQKCGRWSRLGVQDVGQATTTGATP